MEPLTLPLPPTKTYQCRELHWQPVPDQPTLTGVLTIVESVKAKTKAYVHRYLVSEQPNQGTAWVFKLTKPGGEETHWVELSRTAGGWPICQCRGCEAYGRCKHTDSLQALEKAGQLTREAVTT